MAALLSSNQTIDVKTVVTPGKALPASSFSAID
jgi:hypothetical protein